MAKNLFVNTSGLPIEKEMPSLVGMDLSGVGREPLKLNIGKTISDFATKAQALKEQANATKLYNQLLDEEQKWKIDNLSDPNAFSNKERRTEITKSYNSLIERKKAILLEGKNGISADQYSALEGQFKQQTYNSLFDLQTKMNSSYVQETIETMGIEKNALMIKCANTSNYDDILAYEEELGKCFGAEATLGIDNREQRVKLMSTIESNYIQKVIQDDIINNTTDKSLAKLDAYGEPQYDSENNLIMDTNKILKRVNQTRDNLLSEKSIRPSAKKLAKAYGISEDMAYDYIYNARDEYFKVRQSSINQDLTYKSALNEAKLQEIEERTSLKRNQVFKQGEDIIAKNGSLGEILSVSGTNYVSNEQAVKDPLAIEIVTNGQYKNLKDMRNSGYYILSVPQTKVDIFTDAFKKIEDERGFVNAQKEMQSILTGDPVQDSNTFDYLEAQTGMSSSVFRNLAGKGTFTPEETQGYILAIKNSQKLNNKWEDIDIGSTGATPFSQDNPVLNSQLYQYIYDNRYELMGNNMGDYESSDMQGKVSQIVSLYQNNKNFRNKLNGLNGKGGIVSDLKLFNTINRNTRQYRPDFTEGSQLRTYYGNQIDASEQKKNAEKLAKIGYTTVGAYNRYDRLSNTKLYNANLLVQKKGYENGEITLKQLSNLGYFKYDYDVEFFAPTIVSEIDNGKMNKNQILDLPPRLASNEKVNEAIKRFREKSKAK